MKTHQAIADSLVPDLEAAGFGSVVVLTGARAGTQIKLNDVPALVKLQTDGIYVMALNYTTTDPIEYRDPDLVPKLIRAIRWIRDANTHR